MGRGKGEEEGLSLKNEIKFLLLSVPHSWMGGLKSQILLHSCSHPHHLHAIRTDQLHTHAPPTLTSACSLSPLPHSSIFSFWQCFMVCGILVPQPWIEPVPPATDVWSLNPLDPLFLTSTLLVL